MLTPRPSWREQQQSETLVHREVNRLTHPDVPVWLVFEGLAQPTVLAGSATTDALHDEAARLHNLDADQQLRFLVQGRPLPRGTPISETALANTENLQVSIMPCQWPVKRGYANPSSSGFASTSTAVAATRARGNKAPVARTVLRCDQYDAGTFKAEYDRESMARQVRQRAQRDESAD